MKKLRLLASSVLILMMFTMVSSVAAQSYSFNLTKEVVNVYWNSDGTEALDYVFTFANDPGGHVIDFVDVGMPNGNYGDLYSPPTPAPAPGSTPTPITGIYADVGGNPVSLSSDFQGNGSYGFAVDMGAYAIQPGQTGSVHVYVGQITQVLYKDTSDPTTYDSADFSPAYYTTAHGNTDLTVVFHLPPGVQSQEPRYHATQGGWPCADQPATGYDDQNRIIYTWQCSTASGSTQYTFGASQFIVTVQWRIFFFVTCVYITGSVTYTWFSLVSRAPGANGALRNLPPGAANPRLSVAITGRHTLLGEALAKLIAARLRIGVHRPVAGDVEHRANVIEGLVVEPAFAPRALDCIAIRRGLALPKQDVAAFVVVDQPLHLARQGVQGLHVEHDHGRGHGKALEVPEQGLGAAAGEPPALDDEPACRHEPVLLDSHGLRLRTRHDQRKQKRKSGPQAGSRPHAFLPCCP